MSEPMEPTNDTMIKVVGVNGGGGNVVEHMACERTEGVEFFAVNTNTQALRKMAVGQTVQIGSDTTKGLGTSAGPEVGRDAADKDREALRAALGGINMMFITVGMGGGTDIGAASVIAEVVGDLGILIVAVVTKPFNFEGKKCIAFAEQGITKLSKYVDSLITIPNGKLLKALGCDISPLDALDAANDMLKGTVQSIVELTTRPGLMNIDFADVCTVVSEMGYTAMGSGVVSGENRVEEAAEVIISSPLLEDIGLSGTRGAPVDITAGFDLRLDEFETVGNTIRTFVSDNTAVVIGTSLDLDMSGELRVTVAATGIGMDKRPEITLVTNKQVQQPVVDRYQQHGMALLT